jgi:hypothetical protein
MLQPPVYVGGMRVESQEWRNALLAVGLGARWNRVGLIFPGSDPLGNLVSI